MWPVIAGVLFVVVVVLGAYLWLQPAASQPATVVYEDDWWPWYGSGWYGPGSSSSGWWPWVPGRRPHPSPPHHPPHHWLGPGGTAWPRPHRLGPGGMAPHIGAAPHGGMAPHGAPHVGGAPRGGHGGRH